MFPSTIAVVSGIASTRDHAIFGGCLRSELPLPELPLVAGVEPDWFFRQSSSPPPCSEFLGEDAVDANIRVRCGRIEGGFRLDFDDTGIFAITQGGRAIAWTPGTTDALELVRADLLGGVFSIALHAQGLLCLHGSAVAVAGAAVGFLANKGSGKSTLATAMCAAGATLITDDMLPLHPGSPVVAWPSMPAVRLLHDSAVQLRHARGRVHPVTGKYHLSALPDEQVERGRLPVGAIYELAPVPRGPNVPPVRRTRVKGPQAVATLLRHSRTGTAIGGAESMNLFLRASDIVRNVPVYRLEIVRDFERLPDAVDQIARWCSEGDSSLVASGQ